MMELSDCPNLVTDWMLGNRTGPCEDCGHPKNKHPRQQGKFCQVAVRSLKQHSIKLLFYFVLVISYIVAVITYDTSPSIVAWFWHILWMRMIYIYISVSSTIYVKTMQRWKAMYHMLYHSHPLYIYITSIHYRYQTNIYISVPSTIDIYWFDIYSGWEWYVCISGESDIFIVDGSYIYSWWVWYI
jgi:hypothetical protein